MTAGRRHPVRKWPGKGLGTTSPLCNSETVVPPVVRDVRRTRAEVPLFTRPFVMLSLAELGYFTADGFAMYALPLYVTGPVGSGAAGAGLAFGAFALTALVLRPVAGRLSDTLGRFPLMLFGATVSCMSLALTANMTTLTGVVIVRLLFGVGEAAFFVAAFAALADLAPPARLGEALSYNSLSLYLGIAIGPVVGGVLADTVGLRAAWYGAAAFALCAVGCALGVGETLEPTEGAKTPGRLIHWPAVPIGLGFLASIVAMAGFLTFATLRAGEVDLGNASLPLFAYGITVVACRLAFAKVPDRVASLPLGAAALTTMTAGLSIASLWRTPAGLLLGTVVLAIGVAFSTPAFFSAMFATATPRRRGAASATASLLLDVGLGIGPLALGVVAGSFGISWAFATAASVALVGAAWVVRLGRSRTSAHAD